MLRGSDAARARTAVMLQTAHGGDSRNVSHRQLVLLFCVLWKTKHKQQHFAAECTGLNGLLNHSGASYKPRGAIDYLL